jgi:hypothetical protein
VLDYLVLVIVIGHVALIPIAIHDVARVHYTDVFNVELHRMRVYLLDKETILFYFSFFFINLVALCCIVWKLAGLSPSSFARSHINLINDVQHLMKGDGQWSNL